MLVVLSMTEPDSSARQRERRRQRRRRQVRLRRTVAGGVLLALAAGITLGARAVAGGHQGASEAGPSTAAVKAKPTPARREVPDEIRGVHVTMALASLPGKLEQYLALPGLNAIELDVKDENGRVGFVPSSVPLARRTGAAGRYYKASQVARQVHAHVGSDGGARCDVGGARALVDGADPVLRRDVGRVAAA